MTTVLTNSIDDAIVTQVHLYGARIVSGLYSRKLSLVENVANDPRISPSVVTYLNTLIYCRNQEVQKGAQTK